MTDNATTIPGSDWMRVDEAAAALDCSRRTIERRIRSGDLESRLAEDGRRLVRVAREARTDRQVAAAMLDTVSDAAERSERLAMVVSGSMDRLSRMHEAGLAEAERRERSARMSARVAWSIAAAVAVAAAAGVATSWRTASDSREGAARAAAEAAGAADRASDLRSSLAASRAAEAALAAEMDRLRREIREADRRLASSEAATEAAATVRQAIEAERDRLVRRVADLEQVLSDRIDPPVGPPSPPLLASEDAASRGD